MGGRKSLYPRPMSSGEEGQLKVLDQRFSPVFLAHILSMIEFMMPTNISKRRFMSHVKLK